MLKGPASAAVPSALLLLVLLPHQAVAEWPGDPHVNVPLCVATGAQRYEEAAPDSGGGAIVAWDDQRGGPRDIYAQRVDVNGVPRWTTDGVVLCAAAGEQYEPKLVSDGNGGAIVTWSDYRGGVAYDIYAQRVSASGAPLWTPNGVGVCTAANFQQSPVIVADGAGGAIITWGDSRVGNAKSYAQRVDASGAPQWTVNGVPLNNSPAGQSYPVIVSNGASGAIVAWFDYRNGFADIYAQCILSTGAIHPSWPAGGLAISTVGGSKESVGIVADGSGGALISYAQWAGGTRDIYVKHVLATGALDPTWPAGGRVLIVDAYDQADPVIVTDGAGGAVIAWDNLRGPSQRDIYAQHVLATGALDPAWPDSGRALCAENGDQVSPRIVTDGAGGAIVTWWDKRADAGDIYAQRVTAAGTKDPAWPTHGRAMCTADLLQAFPAIVADGAGGAVVAWEDRRTNAGPYGEDGEIYAQRVKGNGQIGDVTVDVPADLDLAFSLESLYPNPARTGAIHVRFTLPGDAPAFLELFDLAGRRIASRDVGSLGAGRHAVDLGAGKTIGAGVYFVRLEQGRQTRVQRIVVMGD